MHSTVRIVHDTAFSVQQMQYLLGREQTGRYIECSCGSLYPCIHLQLLHYTSLHYMHLTVQEYSVECTLSILDHELASNHQHCHCVCALLHTVLLYTSNIYCTL